MVKEQLHCQNKVCSEQMYNPLVQIEGLVPASLSLLLYFLNPTIKYIIYVQT